jgi:RNA polymerase sigma-70 factor (ECF subfamily)
MPLYRDIHNIRPFKESSSCRRRHGELNSQRPEARQPVEKPMVDWKAIVERHSLRVFQVSYRLTYDRHEAEDAMQEAFIDALEFSRREDVKDWGALLTVLATRRGIGRLRKRKGRSAREESADWGAVASRTPAPAQRAEEAELSENLRKALANVPERQAEVFWLHDVEGWGHEEIAGELGMTNANVRVSLHRARAALRGLLASAAPVASPSAGDEVKSS